MTQAMSYTTGGTVQAGNGIYLSRQADRELLQACQEGIFAFVLAPRQIGKSSLMTRTAEQLQADGIQAVVIDLQAIGVQVNAEQWTRSTIGRSDRLIPRQFVKHNDTIVH